MHARDQLVHLKYRADIDGVRATAVIAVVLYHAFPALIPGGFIGVDVFFVISGYLITDIITGGLDSPGAFGFAGFYARRIRRIFPALIVVLSAALAAGVWIFLPAELISLAKNAIASALFCANLMLLSETGYFDLDANLKPLLHLWSLGIEEQFYLAWPLALWLTPQRWRRAMIVIVLLGSFALNVALVRTYPQATFYLPLTRAWELLAGALLVGVTIENAKLKEMFAALAIVFFVAFFVEHGRMTFPGWAALLPVAGTCLILLADGCLFSRIVLSHPLATAIGRISYPLYLWHWPLLVFPHAYLFRPLTASETVLSVGAATALAWLTYAFIERPIRTGRWGGARTALAGMAAVAAGAVIAWHIPPQLPPDIGRLVDVAPAPPAQSRTQPCMAMPALADGEFSDACVELQRPLIAVLGDSTAAALLPGLRDLQSRHRFGIAQFAMAGCQPLSVTAYGVSEDCLRRNRDALTLLAVAHPDIVLFEALWVVSGPDQLRPSIAALRAGGIARIVVLGRVPNWTGGLPNAIAAYYRRTGRLLPERTPLFVENEDEPMQRFSNALGVEYISSRQVFCNEAGCLNRIGDQLVTHDGFHLAPTGSKYLIDQIAPALLREGP
ncbi:acyltransferase family protein [Bradyrhizobium sp.]|uniref:acyltransferase family protein n=1 Tax=Bradyrhizobium sp. TaxID=376 RepID=UPI003C571220